MHNLFRCHELLNTLGNRRFTSILLHKVVGSVRVVGLHWVVKKDVFFFTSKEWHSKKGGAIWRLSYTSHCRHLILPDWTWWRIGGVAQMKRYMSRKCHSRALKKMNMICFFHIAYPCICGVYVCTWPVWVYVHPHQHVPYYCNRPCNGHGLPQTMMLWRELMTTSFNLNEIDASQYSSSYGVIQEKP